MFRSVFSRMLTAFLLVLLFAMTFLSVMVCTMLWDNNLKQAQKETLYQAHEISSTYSYYMQGEMTANVITRRLSESAKTYEATLWVVSRSGLVLTVQGAAPLENTFSDTQILTYVEQVMDGNSLILEDIFNREFGNTSTLTVIVPCIDARGSVVAAVFVHRQIRGLQQNTFSFLTRVAIAAFCALVAGTGLLFVLARRMTSPIRKLSMASMRIAQGHFDTRVDILNQDEIGALAVVFNHMAEDLETLEKQRRDFVANVSHELRSPLTSMNGYLQGMLDGTIPQEEYTRYMQVVLDETQRLSRLVKDLLDLSRMDSGSVPLKQSRFDINEMIRRVLINNEGRIEEKQVEIELTFAQEPCFVWADRDRIEQVVTNLLDNALKFTRDQITVFTTKGEERLFVTVRNNGQGIAPSDLPFIFDRFYKGEKAHTSGMGTGLGLSIVKKILEAHKQEIHVNSNEGCTEFVFSLLLDTSFDKGKDKVNAG